MNVRFTCLPNADISDLTTLESQADDFKDAIALSKSNSTSLSDRFFESQHHRPSETEFVNSGSFSLSRCSVRSATSKLNHRQTKVKRRQLLDLMAGKNTPLINELLIQTSKNIQNISSSNSVTSRWSRPRLSSYTIKVFKFLCLLSF